jgi:hypothetical protein
MITVKTSPRHQTFPGLGPTVICGGQSGFIAGREFDPFTRLWYYRVQWPNFTTELVQMTDLTAPL